MKIWKVVVLSPKRVDVHFSGAPIVMPGFLDEETGRFFVLTNSDCKCDICSRAEELGFTGEGNTFFLAAEMEAQVKAAVVEWRMVGSK